VPLQNRCDPFGALHAVSARGTMMGNRGGRIHDPATKRLKGRRWASRAWICCVTEFCGRQHNVWGPNYTALFFLDEVTALAAGHRPCFECRNADAKRFATLWADATGQTDRMVAREMDVLLHMERLAKNPDRACTVLPDEIETMPSGIMVGISARAFAVKDGELRPWSFSGYGRPEAVAGRSARLITPPSIVNVITAGYEPHWHGSADGKW